ncbi:MAG: PAS domain S-box protein [candidate division Zixibacteria bacterium]|nr:PAS domain S-box protein [candidate division Zixibacteria bacterium]
MYQQALPINRKILLIDDDHDVHCQFRTIVDSVSALDIKQLNTRSDSTDNPAQFQKAFQLDFAYDGNEGCQRILEEEIAGTPYALAFINDKLSPGLDGVETIRKIWGDAPDLEVVLCLTNTDYSYEHIVDALGTSEQLFVARKPLDPLEIKQLAETLTRKWSFRHATRQSMHAVRDEYICRVRELENANKALQAELISARREQASLNEEFHWYQVMFDNVGDSIMVCSLDSRGIPGNFINVNVCACARFGYSRDEFLELHPSHIIFKQQETDNAESIYKLLLKRGEMECECLGITREGQRIPITLIGRCFEHQGKMMVMMVVHNALCREQFGVGAFVRKPFTQQSLGREVRAELNRENAAVADQPVSSR